MKLYEQLADNLREHIEQGLFQIGERLPSVRQLSAEHGVSISTVQEAYRYLEMESLVEARPKSGYFVTGKAPAYNLPQTSRPPQRPLDISQWEEVLQLLLSKNSAGSIQLQHAMPNMTTASLQPLLKKLSDLSRHSGQMSLPYGDIRGYTGFVGVT